MCTAKLAIPPVLDVPRQAWRVAALLFLGAWRLQVFAQAPEPVSVDAYFHLKSITEAAISADGRRIAYLVASLDPDRGCETVDLWIIDSDGANRRQLSSTRAIRDHLTWSADGSRIAYILEKNEKRSLEVLDLHTLVGETLSGEHESVHHLSWSPDGRSIAYTATTPLPPRSVRPGYSPDVKLAGNPPLSAHLFVVDLISRSKRQLAAHSGNIDDLCWSPQGNEIAFSARPQATAHDLAFASDIYAVRLGDGVVRALVQRPGMDVMPRWSPDGKWIAFLSHDGHQDYLGATFLCVVPAQGGMPRNLTPEIDERIVPVTPAYFEWAADSRSLYFSVPHHVARILYRIELSGGASAVTPNDRLYAGFSFAHNGSRMALLISDPSTPWELYVSDVKHFSPRLLVTSNPNLNKTVFGNASVIRWKARDGHPIEGILVLPVHYQKDRSYATITYLHGGPSSVFGLCFTPQVNWPDIAQVEPLAPQLLPSRGYAVFLPNPRGSGGYGRAFMTANVGKSPETETEDALAGINHLVSIGLADRSRLGIMGWSAGGEQTVWAISHSGMLHAAVAGAADVDEAAAFGEQYHPDLMLAYMKAAPWQSPQTYVAHSSIFFAANIHTPTLILQGEDDNAVPVGQGKELFRALTDLHVPVEFAIYPRQGHNFSDPALMRDAVLRTLAWFERWTPPR